MKIGIDISLSPGDKAGVGTYSQQLVKNLSILDKKNDYTLFPFFHHIFDPNFKKITPPAGAQNMKVKFSELPFDWVEYLWKKSWIPRSKFLNDLDLIHITTFVMPPDFKGKIVSTIYDITFKIHPEFHTPENIAHCDKGTREAVEKADAIITISKNSKEDLIKHYGCDPQKIHVTLLAGDEHFKPCDNYERKEAVRKKYRLQKPFILNVGTVEPRKNVLGLIKAYLTLPEKIQTEFELVIAGGKGWLNSDIFDFIKKNKLENKVRFLGFVDDEDLPIIYNLAKIFVYPSFYEGFGLPVIEAMSGGCPVICSNISSMPEIGKEAAELINPHDFHQIGQSLKTLLKDEKKLGKMKEKGLKHAKNFSWKKCARQTLDIYEKLLG